MLREETETIDTCSHNVFGSSIDIDAPRGDGNSVPQPTDCAPYTCIDIDAPRGDGNSTLSIVLKNG